MPKKGQFRDEAERFFEKVRVTPGCWIWEGAAKSSEGYGSFFTRKLMRATSAHRWSYEHYIGEIPEGLFVCHRCDNPGCVNPDHFFIGTAKDNNDDKMRKGRFVRLTGPTHGSSKVTEDIVRAMRAEWVPGDPRFSTVALAKKYGIGKSQAYNIVSRKQWRETE